MELSSTVLICIAFLIAIIFISRPFRVSVIGSRSKYDRRSELLQNKRTLIVALNDLEQDHQLEKLSSEEYFSSRQKLINAGGDIIKQLDSLKGSHKPNTKFKETDNPIVDEEIEDMLSSRRIERNRQFSKYCPHCNKNIHLNDKFCPQCGEKIISIQSVSK